MAEWTAVRGGQLRTVGGEWMSSRLETLQTEQKIWQVSATSNCVNVELMAGEAESEEEWCIVANEAVFFLLKSKKTRFTTEPKATDWDWKQWLCHCRADWINRIHVVISFLICFYPRAKEDYCDYWKPDVLQEDLQCCWMPERKKKPRFVRNEQVSEQSKSAEKS